MASHSGRACGSCRKCRRVKRVNLSDVPQYLGDSPSYVYDSPICLDDSPSFFNDPDRAQFLRYYDDDLFDWSFELSPPRRPLNSSFQERAFTSSPSQRDIDPREVTARMDSPIVKAVLKMDVPKDLVQKAIKQRLAENGEDFTSAEALLEAVFSSGHAGDAIGNASLEQGEIPEKGFQERDSPSYSSSSESQDSLKLMEENRLLKEQRQCKICMDEEVCVVFLPCGHLVCCATCAPALNSCPICRAKIRGSVRTYIS